MSERDIEEVYAPNQQNVRPDGSGPAEEGEGGSTIEDPYPKAEADPLDSMTKDELLEEARRLGVSPANAGMSKEELRAGIDAQQVEE